MFTTGQKVTTSGHPGAIIRQYSGAMLEVRLASGMCCVDACDIRAIEDDFDPSQHAALEVFGSASCTEFTALVNDGDFRGKYCCTCGEKEKDHPLVWDALWTAMRAEPHAWVPTTERMYWHMLECVPPIDAGHGAFLVGEPNHHNDNGEPVYAGFVSRNGFMARYMSRREFAQWKAIRN